MAFNVFSFLINQRVAVQAGAPVDSANRLAVVGGLFGDLTTGLVITSVLARREAESLPPPVPQKATIEVFPPSEQLYGDVEVGFSDTKTFVVKNIGDAKLDISATTIVLINEAPRFAIDSGDGPFTVAPGATHNVEVSFTPDDEVEFKADLVIFSNDLDRSKVTIALSGAGVNTPGIEVTPPVLHHYGSHVLSADIDIKKCFIVSNIGTKILTGTVALDPLTTSDFEIVSGTSFSIDPGATHDVEVSFNPPDTTAVPGNKQATLIITSSDKKRPIVNITLTAEIKPPDA